MDKTIIRAMNIFFCLTNHEIDFYVLIITQCSIHVIIGDYYTSASQRHAWHTIECCNRRSVSLSEKNIIS